MYHVGGIEMKLPLMVGAGACKTPPSILPYMREDVSVGAVSTGSYTPDLSLGNDGVLFWPPNLSEFTQKGFGLNSFGMPNAGFKTAAKEFHRQYAHPVIVSVAGFSVDDYVLGVKAFDSLPGIAAIKANFGCGNRHDKKPVPIAYDLDSMSRILKAIQQLRMRKPLWLKLSPYITAEERDALQNMYPHIDFSQVPVVEPGFLGDVMSIVWEYQFVRAVVFSNTLANVIVRDDAGTPVTTPNGGKAGLSGPILKSISIGLIREAVKMLPGDVDLIASGGMLHGDDAVDAFEAGASAAFCTSGPFWSGNDPRFFADLLSGSERLQNFLTDIPHHDQADVWPQQRKEVK